jgi:hypothetical protein
MWCSAAWFGATISVSSPPGWHPSTGAVTPFPGEVLLDLAADAIPVSGATRGAPLEFEGIRERYLPEGTARTRAQHHKSKFALRAAAMVRAGLDPALLDEVQWLADR